LIEKLTERICANTPAQNVRGHLCFILLLNDLLPNYYKEGLTGAIKKIDQNTLMWYVDLMIGDKNTIDDRSSHHSALMCILKYLSMFTEHNLLQHWFDLLITHPTDAICFELIEHSLCPTTTLATYIQHINEIQVQQVHQCIQFELANQYIPTLLTILESLVKSIQTQKYLFRSDDLHCIVQTWLSKTTLPSIIIRLIELLIDIGYSKYNQHGKDIAKFFLNEYSFTLISTNFEGHSPLAHIILFITSIKNSDEMNAIDIYLSSEQLIQLLFKSIYETTDDDTGSSAFHLLSLSEDIVKPRSRTTLIQLLSSFIPDIMGLLGRTSLLKKAGIILLAEILDLSSNERSVLMDNVQIDSTMDNTSEFVNNTQQQQQQQQQQILFFSTEQSKASDV
ncbi:unnamed protein product, partial [Rotaria magnacalcarata]